MTSVGELPRPTFWTNFDFNLARSIFGVAPKGPARNKGQTGDSQASQTTPCSTMFNLTSVNQVKALAEARVFNGSIIGSEVCAILRDHGAPIKPGQRHIS